MSPWLRRRSNRPPEAGATPRDAVPATPQDAVPTGPATLQSLEAAKQEDPFGLAGPVLLMASVLDPAGHPEGLWKHIEVLKYLAEHACPPPGAQRYWLDVPHEQVWATLELLHRHGLLSRSPEAGGTTVRIDARTAGAVGEAASPEELHDAVRAAGAGLGGQWPREHHEEQALTSVLLANLRVLLANDPDEALYLPEPKQVLFRAGTTLYHLGRIDTAVEHWTRVADACRRLLPDAGHDYTYYTLSAIGNLAVCLKQAGRYEEALELEVEIVAAHERLDGPDYPSTLVARSNLAASYDQLGRTDESIAQLEQSLAGLLRIYNEDFRDALIVKGNLAAAYRKAGRTEEALVMEEQVLAGRERVFGPDHPGTLSARVNLASTYDALGRRDEAIALEVQIVADRERVLGADHPDTLMIRANLSTSYYRAGRTEEAITLIEQVIAARIRVLSGDHPDTLSARGNLAAYFGAAGRPDDAIALMRQVSADAIRALGPDDPMTRRVVATLEHWTSE